MLPPGIILIGIIGLSGVLAAFVGAALGKNAREHRKLHRVERKVCAANWHLAMTIKDGNAS